MRAIDDAGARLVLTGGEDRSLAIATFGLVQHVVFERIVDFYKAVEAGKWYVGPCTTPDELSSEIREEAGAFARNIVSAGA